MTSISGGGHGFGMNGFSFGYGSPPFPLNGSLPSSFISGQPKRRRKGDKSLTFANLNFFATFLLLFCALFGEMCGEFPFWPDIIKWGGGLLAWPWLSGERGGGRGGGKKRRREVPKMLRCWGGWGGGGCVDSQGSGISKEHWERNSGCLKSVLFYFQAYVWTLLKCVQKLFSIRNGFSATFLARSLSSKYQHIFGAPSSSSFQKVPSAENALTNRILLLPYLSGTNITVIIIIAVLLLPSHPRKKKKNSLSSLRPFRVLKGIPGIFWACIAKRGDGPNILWHKGILKLFFFVFLLFILIKFGKERLVGSPLSLTLRLQIKSRIQNKSGVDSILKFTICQMRMSVVSSSENSSSNTSTVEFIFFRAFYLP